MNTPVSFVGKSTQRIIAGTSVSRISGGRARESTRFDPHNAVAACTLPCHNYYGHGEGREEYKKKMIEWLGQEEFDRLDIRAHQSKKRDDVMDIFIIEELIKTPNPDNI